MRIALGFALGLFGAFVSAAADAQSLHTAPRGTKVTGSFEIGGIQFPLPAGNWVLAGRGEQLIPQASGNIKYAGVFLVEVVEGKFSRGIYVNTPLANQGSGTGWSRNTSICDRQNTYFNQSDRNFNPREARCVDILHFVVSTPNTPDETLKDYREYLADAKIIDPPIKVGSAHWLTDSNRYIRAQFVFNPEIVGVAAGPFERWDAADWNRERIRDFPDKLAWMGKIQTFGREIQGQLEQGLRRRLALGVPINIQVADWPTPVAAPVQPASNDVAAPVSRSPADRLRALDDLKSQGLVSDVEYRQQRQRILDGM